MSNDSPFKQTNSLGRKVKWPLPKPLEHLFSVHAERYQYDKSELTEINENLICAFSNF